MCLQSESLYGTQYGDKDPRGNRIPNYSICAIATAASRSLAAFNIALGVALDTGKDPAIANGFATTGITSTCCSIHPYLGRFFHALR